jgi:hypothetical protein
MSAPNEIREVIIYPPEIEAARAKVRRRRSLALGAALFLFAVTFYVLTIIKMGPAVFDRAI